MALVTPSYSDITAFSETLASEVSQFNIRVTIVEPGGFFTKGTERAIKQQSGSRICDYDHMRSISSEKFREVSEAFIGDSKKAMELVVDVVKGEGKAKGRPWPLHLFLGNEAYKFVRNKCSEVMENMDAWQEVAKDLDLDEGEVMVI